MTSEYVKLLLDNSNIKANDEIKILEYIYELEKVTSQTGLDVFEDYTDKYIKLNCMKNQVIEYIDECINNLKNSDDEKVIDFITILEIIRRCLKDV